MYHGTDIERGKRMLRKQRMEYSRGDDHWLGDGIYLYRERLYVFRWIVIKFKERNPSRNIKSELLNQYIILNVDIDYDNKKVFSLMNPEHKLIFEYVKDKCKNRATYSKRFQTHEITDGVVLNIMFKNLDYGNDYNMVEAVFPLDNCQKQGDSRTNIFDEYQLCIKDPKAIIKLYDFTPEIYIELDEYFDKLQKFNNYRSSHSIKYNI